MANIELCGYSMPKAEKLRREIFLLFGDEEVHVTVNLNCAVDKYRHEHSFIRIYDTISGADRNIDKLRALKTTIEWIRVQTRIEPELKL